MSKLTAIRKVLIFPVGVFFLIGGLFGAYRYFYPFGDRGCGLACTVRDLRNYANDHGGWFPNNGGLGFQSLEMLGPYSGNSGNLAGISGDMDEVRRRLQSKKSLDEKVSGLIYFPGLRDDDDPHLMIVYEKELGVSSTGRRMDGHAVGFVGGFVQQIPSRDWGNFLKSQEVLRRHLAGRVAPTNTDRTLSSPQRLGSSLPP